MTIKGSLYVSIPIVKAFLNRKFPSPVKNWPKISVLGGNGVEIYIFVFETPKGTSLRETTSFDVLIVKIGAGVLAVRCRKNPPPPQKKTSRVTLCGFSHIWGTKRSNRIVIKFCIRVRVPDVITHANFGDDGFRGFWGSGGRISHFSIDLRCRP